MSNRFSDDGKYFAEISVDGKVKIWETATSTFKQEFTPNLHLSSPCTCLHWIHSKAQTPFKKRKRRQSETSTEENSNYFIALGTNSGALILYSLASADVQLTIDSNTSQSINCITWEQTKDIYAGSENFVLQFNLKEKSVKSKWKAGTEKINSILLIPNSSSLLTASKSIYLWNLECKEKIKSFTGHSSEVSILQFIPAETPYVISGSKGDRLLNCWSLNEKSRDTNAVASILMEDITVGVSLVQNSENVTNLAAVTRSGVLHVYQFTLNGKSIGKPTKPKVTIQVSCYSEQNKDLATPIPIVGAYFYDESSITICHGNSVALTFENVVPSSYEKIQCLLRKDPCQSFKKKETAVQKVKQPIVDNSVEYLTPFTTEGFKTKRKVDGEKIEGAMEKRLENLTLNKLESGVPKQDNLAQLLMQGLCSKDKDILKSVLCKRNDDVIKNTVKRLPMPVIVPLLNELSVLVQGKTLSSQTGALWLRYLIQTHASQLLANPQLVELIGPILSSITNRLTLLTPLSKLSGRLDLLVSQISDSNKKEKDEDGALLVYKDQGSSDSDSDDNIVLNLHSESENEWVEEEDNENNSNEEDDDVIKENNVSDSEMSM